MGICGEMISPPTPSGTRPAESALSAFAREGISPPSALRLIGRLVGEAGGTGMDTSAGVLFNHSVWARDRIISALDVLQERPEVARQTILTLARLQGTRRRTRSEEEPGRIHNELRDLHDWRAPLHLKALFGLVLAPLWGGSPRGYVSYFGADGTPLFILLVDEYAKLRPAVLDEAVARDHGGPVTVAGAVREAARWIESHLSPDGLVEVPKHNVLSLPPQTWKDSPTSNFDERGRMLNVVEPIAYLPIQALCADALEAAAGLVRHSVALPAGGPVSEQTIHDLAWSELLEDEARTLRRRTQRAFWMEDAAYYAFALDRDGDGRRRVVRAIQSDPGWLLTTKFFDELPAAERERSIAGIVRTLFSPDVLTSAGVRGRSLRHADARFRNYHEHVWPMDTFMIARGLRRQGLGGLADELETRTVNAVNLLGDPWEFIAVDDDGAIVHPRLDADEAARLSPPAHGLPSEMAPEADIAWSATALLRIKRDRAARWSAGGLDGDGAQTWQRELTHEVLAGLRPAPVCRSVAELAAAAAPLSPLFLDQPTGMRRAMRVVILDGFAGVIPRSMFHQARRRLRAGLGRGRAA